MEKEARSPMYVYTVYHYPGTEWPYRVRRFTLVDGTPEPDKELCIVAKDLDLVREDMLAMGLVMFLRDDSDAPEILETWL